MADSPAPAPRGSSVRQLARPLGASAAPNGFYEYLPPSYEQAERRLPLLIFWHGRGENGNGSTELHRVTVHGPPMLIATDRWPAAREFIVLSPQHSGAGCPDANEVHAFVAWALATYRVDPQRVYLTGMSCGAIGIWAYLAEHVGRVVAAVVLVAGDPGDPNNARSAWARAGCKLREVALWAYHGEADTTVPIGNERTTMTHLQECAAHVAQELKWSPIPGGLHNIWSGIYDGTTAPDIYEWLLAQAKP